MKGERVGTRAEVVFNPQRVTNMIPVDEAGTVAQPEGDLRSAEG